MKRSEFIKKIGLGVAAIVSAPIILADVLFEKGRIVKLKGNPKQYVLPRDQFRLNWKRKVGKSYFRTNINGLEPIPKNSYLVTGTGEANILWFNKKDND